MKCPVCGAEMDYITTTKVRAQHYYDQHYCTRCKTILLVPIQTAPNERTDGTVSLADVFSNPGMRADEETVRLVEIDPEEGGELVWDPEDREAPQVSYSSQVIADKPALYWRLDETVGTTAADSSGNGRPGTYQGAYSLGFAGATQDGDNAMKVTASSSSTFGGAKYTGGGLPSGNAPISLEAWVKSPDLSNYFNWFGVAAPNGACFFVYTEPAAGGLNGIGLTIAPGTGKVYPFGNIADGNWHHVVATYDGNGTFALYVDGVAQTPTTTTGSATMNMPGSVASIGGSNNGNACSGTWDEFAVYPTCLSPAQVATHYLAGIPATVGLNCQLILDAVGYWIEPGSFSVARSRTRSAQHNRQAASGNVGSGERYVDLGPGKREWKFTVVAFQAMRDYLGNFVSSTGQQFHDALQSSYNKINTVLTFIDPAGASWSVRFDDLVVDLEDVRAQGDGELQYYCHVTLVEA